MSLKVTQAECIKTERLELKSYRSSDKEQLTNLLTKEGITKTFMVPEFKSEEHMLSLIEKLIAFSQTEDTAHLEYGIF